MLSSSREVPKDARQPELGRCKYFVQRKKRYCRMIVKDGQDLCGEHQAPVESSEQLEKGGQLRIVCPLDRNQQDTQANFSSTVYAHKLQKHLKICNARQFTQVPYIRKDINSGKYGVTETSNENFKFLSSFSTGQILEVIEKVNKIFNEQIKDHVSEKLLSHKLVDDEMQKPEYGDKTKKHLIQSSAILGLLKEYDLLTKDKACFIEFGGGRGQLSCWIAQATEAIETSKILILERASPKHKRDNKISKSSDKIQRIRADIKDIVLDNVDLISDSKEIIGVTKHLCGEATDLAIRCLSNMSKNRNKLCGVVFTFCCHHRCCWTPYTGKQFLQDNGLTKDDFDVMRGMSSWATCGSGFSREYRESMKSEQSKNSTEINDSNLNKHIEENLLSNERENELGLTRAEKEEIGRRCKNLINWGRLTYLTNLNLTCLLHYYVNRNVTLENVCIVAFKEKI